MAAPSVTYTFSNSTTADATQVNQNFTDLINGASDGTKDYSISALTCAGTATLNGNVNLGNASGDDLTITASLASTLSVKTTYTYDFGSSTIGMRSLYLGSADSAARTTRVIGATVASSWTMTLPTGVPAGNSYTLESTTAGVTSWANRRITPTLQTFTTGTAATYTTPAGVLYLRVTTVGGGGGGGDSGANPGGGSGGGGGGGAAIKWISSPSATYTYTVGAGGAHAASGGTTSFGSSLCAASGGAAGVGPGTSPIGGPGGSPGIGTSGDILLNGCAGGTGSTSISGTAFGYGGAGGEAASDYGGGGGAGNQGGTGNTGGVYGGGGSGTCGGANNGGAGAAGIIVVEEYYQ